ncbi:MAG: hypothetical protein JXB49_24940 [Bacteroidales bacterium]|nr:hypothetical protein [Bacteroidales bacterium]
MNSWQDKIEYTIKKWREDWPKAREVWSPYLKLREPQFCNTYKDAVKEGLVSSFAMIRLVDHRIVVDVEKLVREGVEDFSIEILSHEIGHHIYAPANLYDSARLLTKMRWALADIEDRAPMAANIYTDLLINDMLQRSKQLNIAGVFQKLDAKANPSLLFTFYLRIYEYLWRMDRGSLATATDLHSPRIDADASLAASLIRSYSKNWLDGGGRFAALLYPYLWEAEEYKKGRKSILIHLDAENAGEGGGIISGLAEIDPEDYEGAIDPRGETGNDGSKKAAVSGLGIKENKGEGPKQRYLNPGVYIDLYKQVNPKVDEQELINNYYREIALPYLVDFPLEATNPLSMTQLEGTESWDISDPVEEIDWIETAVNSPNIFPGYNTVKRTYGQEEDDAEKSKPLDVYIGIDCSGSMGNPRVNFSWPVLAATIIGLSALRAGAKVMGCLSGEPGSFMETDGFTFSDKEVLTVLTSYLGTGYAYGVPRLNTPFGELYKRGSHVIVVSDDDLFSMLDAKDKNQPSNWSVIEKALQNAGGVGTLVLHSKGEWRPNEQKRLRDMGWNIYFVTNEEELLYFATEFSKDHYRVKKRVQ